MTLRSLPRRLARSDRGAVLVEFAMVLPILLLLFAVVIEGGRMMWSYQTAVAGVREAARYVGRVVPSSVCTEKGAISTYVTNATLADMVSKSIEQNNVLPPQVRLNPDAPPGVTATLSCVTGSYRLASTPIATVTAQVRIDLPFEGIFDFAAGGMAPFLVTTITDKSRVFGS